jgi:hypothetical protein
LIASDGNSNDYFGWSGAVDSNTAIISATGDDEKGTDAGSVYVLVRSGTTWTQRQKLLASDGASFDWFGRSVSLDGLTAFVGAYGTNDYGTESGSAYVFVGEISNILPVASIAWGITSLFFFLRK